MQAFACNFLCCGTCHSPAFFCASATGLGAFLAMLIIVVSTFCGTGFTHVGTNTANLCCFAAAQAHQLRRRITYGGTFHIKLDTPCHHFHIFLLRTGRSTMIANSGAPQTGVNTGFVLVIISGHTIWFHG
jgi:hypothetical protein